ncbi:MAG: HupE/UreJ family protein [Nocardioides sp.]|uniref:HupE/UreJ family protein n=1 Tax=Nocardioides sp. TaxID=35761 RepID=UPI0039E46B68
MPLLARLPVAVVALALASLLAPSRAEAHPAPWTTVTVSSSATEVTLAAQIPVSEYELGTGESVNATTAGVAGIADDVTAGVLDGATLLADGAPTTLEVRQVALGTLNGYPSIDVTLTAAATDPSTVSLTWTLLTGAVPSHKIVVSAVVAGTTHLVGVIMAQDPTLDVAMRPSAYAERSSVDLGHMIGLGMTHIATGYDHLLFLTMLLIPVPRRVRRRGRRGVRGALATAGNVLIVATAFTVGHSLTLLLISLKVLSVPERPVETLVALSIAVAAVHAVRPLVDRGEALIAAAFGLVHGSAFATTILEMHLGLDDTLRAVLGFDLGIEAAQLVAIVAVAPLLYVASASRDYRLLVWVVCGLALLAVADWVQAIWRQTTPVFTPVFDTLAAQPQWSWAGLAAVTGAMWLVRDAAEPRDQPRDQPSETDGPSVQSPSSGPSALSR